MLTDKYYINPSSIHLCFPMKIKKSSSTNSSIDTDLITVNNFCAHLVKEISVTRYGHDKQLISTFSPYEIYQYSESMPKHLPKNSLKKNREKLLYSKQSVYFNKAMIDRRINDSSRGEGGPTASKGHDTKDLNIDERTSLLTSSKTSTSTGYL